MSAMPSDLPVIPGYAVEAALGSGGMATVYRGRQLALDRPVAIKVVRAFGRDAAELNQRFEQEAKLIAALDHPNIVAIFEVTRTESGDACYVMPLLAHGDLASQPKPMAEHEVKRILRAVLEALGHAHGKGVVHRDVKPANVLFDARGTPLLADFGVALKVANVERLTAHGRAVGSSQSMSPEQARGEVVDGRSDLYSVGCLAYELLLGEAPFGSDEFLVVALRHQQDPVPRLPPHLAHWQAFFDCALAKRPDQRFATAADMAAALEQIGSAPLALQPEPRLRQPLAAASLGLIAVAALLAGGWWWSGDHTSPASASMIPGHAADGVSMDAISAAIEQRRWFDGSNGSADALLAPLFAAEPFDSAALDLRDRLLDRASADLIAADDATLVERLPRWQHFVMSTSAVDLPPVRDVNLALEARWRPALERARGKRDRSEADAALKLAMFLPGPSPEFAELIDLIARFPARGEPFRDGTGPELLLIPGGRLPGFSAPFAVTRFEISRSDYARFVDASGRRATLCRDGGSPRTWLAPGFEQSAADPVVCVSFADAVAYAAWLSQQSGRSYRLPTLNEWLALSTAARVDRCGNLRGENDQCQDRYPQTSPAGRFASAAEMPADFVGNVREWTATCDYEKAGVAKRVGTFLLNVPRRKENEVANPKDICVGRHVIGSGWRDEQAERAASVESETSAAVDRGFRLIREIR
jgi:serine/threonine protein kinase